MAKKDYIKPLKALLIELRKITLMAMAQAGIKQSSDLSKSVKWFVTKDGVKMEVAEYYPWVSEGRSTTRRRARVAKVPIDALIEWIKRKGLQPIGRKTINQLAFAIQTSIYKKGLNTNRPVQGKGYADKVVNETADFTADKLAGFLAEEIADEMVKALEI
jgi:hypothetical protein